MKKMKKKMTLSMLMLFGLALAAYAQRVEKYPVWTNSKDVQKIQFKNSQYTPAAVSTTDLVSLSSKGISRVGYKSSPTSSSQVQMTGMPSSVISKGIARMNYERNK